LKFFSINFQKEKEKEIQFIKDYFLLKEIEINKKININNIKKSYFEEKYFLFYEDPLVKIFNLK
jgi:hypothetical protein